MKRINSIKQLHAEKKKLVQHQEALEEKIRDNWNALKVNMKPANLAKDAVNGMIARKSTNVLKDKTIVKGLVSVGAAILVKRMAQRKWNRLFRKE